MPGIDYREARARIRLAEVLQLIGYVPRQLVGQQLRGPCPLHGSSSLTSRPASQYFPEVGVDRPELAHRRPGPMPASRPGRAFGCQGTPSSQGEAMTDP